MTPDEIAQRRSEIVKAHGPWRSDNLRLAAGVHTIGEGARANEARVRRVLQHVIDFAAKPVKGLRVLDLGCGEGGFALELGKQGAEVVAIDASAAEVEKAAFARDALGLSRVTVLRGDARRVSPEEHGYFDVVLALGLIDRLDAPPLFEVAKRIGAVCKGFTLVEARLAARARASRESDGTTFRGAPRSVDGRPSFLLTRESMLGLFARSGFTSLVETLDPEQDAGVPCFAAFKGRPVALVTAPQANAVPWPAWSPRR